MNTLRHFKVLTLTHRHTPLKDLGALVLGSEGDTLREQLHAIKAQLHLKELFYLATCNRILFVFLPEQARLVPHFREQFFNAVYPQLDPVLRDRLLPTAQLLEGKTAVRHLFEVASSIDSLVVGEREILRQLRTAYDTCREMDLTGDSIRVAMRYVVEAAKKVYTETRIGEKPVSVVSLAVQQLLRHNPRRSAKVLIVGAGQTNSLVVKLLRKEGFHDFTIFNRSLANAQALADTVQGQAHALADLDNYQGGFDILVACTGATEPIITPARYAQLVGDSQAPKLLVDLSLPNNIDKAIATEFPAHYIELENLQSLAQENLSFRQQEVDRARQLLDHEVEEFITQFKARQIERALREVPEQIKAVKTYAMEEVFRKEVEQLDDQSRALLEKMMAYMERRCIAIPLQVAKENLGQVFPQE